jgi:Tfp pilus assembly protein PilF
MANSSGQPLTSYQFQNSDFVKIEKMFDQDGKPVKFDVSHQGSRYVYQVTLNKPVPPNQVYTGWTEGKVLGLIHGVPGTNDTFEYRMNHHPGGSGPVRRIEIYRLPKGAQLISSTPAEMLRREVNGRIELAHVEMIPEGGSIQTRFVYKLPKEVTKEDRLESERLSARAWKLWMAEDFKWAEELFQKALELNSKNDSAWNGLGWAQFKQEMPENAKDAFEKCIAINPKASGALNGLGFVAKTQNKTDEAIKYWERAIKASPNATSSLLGLTQTYMELKQYDKAAKYYRMWLNVEPNNPEVKAGLEKAESELAKAPAPATAPTTAPIKK